MGKNANHINITTASATSVLRHIPVIFLVLLISMGYLSHPSQENNRIEAAGEAGTPAENRTVLFELFTETWCPPCKNADIAVDELSENYPSSQLAILQFHYDQNGDPFYTDETNDRFNQFYSFDSWPSAMIDGHIQEKGGGEVSEVYERYASHVDSRLENMSHFYIKIVEASHSGNTGYVRAYIAERTESERRNITIFTAIFRDNLYYDGGNGITNHRFVVRRLISEGFHGHTMVVEYNFTLPDDSAYMKNGDNVGIVVFLQDNETHEVLQSSVKLLYTEKHTTTDTRKENSDGKPFYASVYFITAVSGTVAVVMVILVFYFMKKEKPVHERKHIAPGAKKRLSDSTVRDGRMQLGRNHSGKRQDVNRGEEFTTCPVCGAKVKKVNLNSHLKRVHDKT